MRILVLLLIAALMPAQNKYNGPRPAKTDVLYLLHADTLVETEVKEAKEEKVKDDIKYVVSGASSEVKTPLVSPIFLIVAQKISPEQLQLYRLESKGGQREILFSRKKKQTAQAIRMTATRLTSDGLYRLESDESLKPGEYSVTPEGSNQVFCFQVI